MNKTLTSLICIAALALVPAAAGAKPYSGKTKAGSGVTFNLKGKKASRIKTAVPTICVETTGSYKSRAGAELFAPPGAFKLGSSGTAKELQPAAMNMGAKATITYTVDLGKKTGRGKVTGKLRLSFSFIRPGLTLYDMEIFMCQGSTTFSAKPR